MPRPVALHLLLAACIAMCGCIRLSPDESLALHHKKSVDVARGVGRLHWMHAGTLSVSIVRDDGSADDPFCSTIIEKSASPLSIDPSFPGVKSAAGRPVTLRYCADRDGTDSCVDVEWVPVPSISSELRSVPLLLLYPIWGLPRDLVDVPMTGLRRLGFADDTGISDTDPATPIILFTGASIGAVAGATLVILCVSPTAVAIPLAVVAGAAGGVLGLVAGMNVSFVAGDVGRFLADNVQVPLLRSGIDSEDYFPNWKFGVHRPVVTAGDEAASWRAVSMRFVVPPPSPH